MVIIIEEEEQFVIIFEEHDLQEEIARPIADGEIEIYMEDLHNILPQDRDFQITIRINDDANLQTLAMSINQGIPFHLRGNQAFFDFSNPQNPTPTSTITLEEFNQRFGNELIRRHVAPFLRGNQNQNQ